MGLSMVKSLLPALSSLAYVGPAIVASKKKLFSEAFTFTFTTFFLILHHLCQAPGLSIIFCLFGEEFLKYFSIYGSVLSLYITVIQITNLSKERRYNLCTSGGLLTAVRTYYASAGLSVYITPLSVALFMFATSWGHKIWKAKSLYPEREQWIKYLLPGFGLLIISLALKYTFQNSWHIAIALTFHHITMAASIAFLIKIAEDGQGIETKLTKCGCLAACCLC